MPTQAGGTSDKGMNTETRTIKVNYLARVEGEGSLFLKIKGDRVERAEVRIFEPPRFFEAFLRGRLFSEAPDFTARICGICPVAYQMSAVQAMEDALGVEIPEPLEKLRRLLLPGGMAGLPRPACLFPARAVFPWVTRMPSGWPGTTATWSKWAWN